MKTKSRSRLLTGLTGALALGAAAPVAAQEFPRIQLPPGFKIEKVVDGLSFPTSLTWDDQGRMYVAEAGGRYGLEYQRGYGRGWQTTTKQESWLSLPSEYRIDSLAEVIRSTVDAALGEEDRREA